MQVVRGLALTFLAFAAAFVLHIIGGATNQDWLFAFAVVLIIIIATGFSGWALWFAGLADSGSRAAMVTDLLGGIAGSLLTIGVLWAANGRSFEAWHFLAAPLIECGVSALVVFVVVRAGWIQETAVSATS